MVQAHPRKCNPVSGYSEGEGSGQESRRRVRAGLTLPKVTSKSTRQSKAKGKSQEQSSRESPFSITKVIESKTNGSTRGLYFCLLIFAF